MASKVQRYIWIGLVSGGLASWVTVSFVLPSLAPKRFATVEEGVLYRSGEPTPAGLRSVVEKHGIKTVIDLGAWEPGTKDAALAERTAETLGVERHVFDLEGDATGDAQQYVDALRIITDPANHPVLVHCGAGTERTGATVYWFRTLIQGWDPAEAEAEADRIGHSDSRNPLWDRVIEQRTDAVREALESGDPMPEQEPIRREPRE